jgi:hypothetical protein
MYGAISKPSWPLAGALSSYCQDVVVRGRLDYVNYDEEYAGYTYDADTVGLPNVLVTFWDGVTGDSFAVAPLYTDEFAGIFVTPLAYVTHPIYMRFQLIDQGESLVVKDNDNQSVIYTFSDTLGPDNYFLVIRDESSPYEQDIRFARASYSFGYIQQTKEMFQEDASWVTPPVEVLYDYDNLTDLAYTYYIPSAQEYGMHLTSRGAPTFGYRLGTPAHEFAHIIHFKTWNITSPPGCPAIHSPDTPTSGYCALVEGWAEFLSCIFKGDKAKYVEHKGQDLEYNDWWSGPDGVNVDGSIVEGAVASAWYDMEDWDIDNPDEYSDTEYYDLYGEFAKIFDIFKSSKPQNMIEFMR